MIKLPKGKEIVVYIGKVIAKLFFLIILFLLLGSVFTKKASATCYCVDPTADQCKCSASPPADATFPGTQDGADVKCTTPEEAGSTFEKKNPICGTASETIPYCAYSADGNKGFWSCYLPRQIAYFQV